MYILETRNCQHWINKSHLFVHLVNIYSCISGHKADVVQLFEEDLRPLRPRYLLKLLDVAFTLT